MSAATETLGSALVCRVLNAPLVGVHPDGLRVVHAVDADACTPDGPFVGRCGTAGLLLVPVDGPDGSRLIGLWPPRVAHLGEGVTRCRDCVRPRERPRDRGRYIT